ncbi:hypothetical protein PAXRUDRAFT_215902 [Paxillus rubicundulus Ve08.2h10]|uniref:Uncharacterized protein n=1 Tax=Paxillus rubicundulus Ve08.2h10 TaxID=930991 RepID=A0A0D0CDT7_9AGAM|nr:hypothetical protein PAXRUDRAFT_215902 [Paxillus rubicundulus Ve08.2h10]
MLSFLNRHHISTISLRRLFAERNGSWQCAVYNCHCSPHLEIFLRKTYELLISTIMHRSYLLHPRHPHPTVVPPSEHVTLLITSLLFSQHHPRLCFQASPCTTKLGKWSPVTCPYMEGFIHEIFAA